MTGRDSSAPRGSRHATLLVATLLVGAHPILAQDAAPASPASLKIPAPPTPADVSFASEVAGRHLLLDTVRAYATAGAVAFTAHWTECSGAVGAIPPGAAAGEETLRAAGAERKFAITEATMTPGGGREIRRAFSDGTTVLTTDFRENVADHVAQRTWTRIDAEEAADTPRLLAEIPLRTETRGATLALEPHVAAAGPDAVIWRDGDASLPGGGIGETVDVAESVDPNAPPDQRRARRHASRYLIEQATHLILRVESWEIAYSPGASAPTVAYRREEYANVSVRREPPDTAWALPKVPPGYVEAAPARIEIPTLPRQLSPDAYDPRAMAMLEKWRAARERYVSLSTDITVEFRNTPRTSLSRPIQRRQQQDTSMAYRVTFRRPATARIEIRTSKGGGGGGGGGVGQYRQFGPPTNGTAVSNGARWIWDAGAGARTAPVPGPDSLLIALVGPPLSVGDPYEALQFLFKPLPTEWFDRISYDGWVAVGGEAPLEAITLRQAATSATGKQSVEITRQVLFGADGLPRRVLSRHVTTINGRMERDQPPVQSVDVHFLHIQTDSEPPASLFGAP